MSHVEDHFKEDVILIYLWHVKLNKIDDVIWRSQTTCNKITSQLQNLNLSTNNWDCNKFGIGYNLP